MEFLGYMFSSEFPVRDTILKGVNICMSLFTENISHGRQPSKIEGHRLIYKSCTINNTWRKYILQSTRNCFAASTWRHARRKGSPKSPDPTTCRGFVLIFFGRNVSMATGGEIRTPIVRIACFLKFKKSPPWQALPTMSWYNWHYRRRFRLSRWVSFFVCRWTLDTGCEAGRSFACPWGRTSYGNVSEVIGGFTA